MTTSDTRTVTRHQSRLLPWSGVAAGITGAVATMMSSAAVDTSAREDDPAGAVIDAFEGLATTLKASAALGFLAIALLVVFVADLRRRLAAQERAGSIAPAVAWAGGLLTGGALAVSFAFAAMSSLLVDEGYRDTTLEVFSVITDNLAFAAWTPLGLTMAAIAVGALRNGSAPRWLGLVSALIVVVFVAALAVGLPFASWALGCVWLIVTGFACTRDRTARLR